MLQMTKDGVTTTYVLDSITNVAFQSASTGDQRSVLTGSSLDSHLAAISPAAGVEYALFDGVNSTIRTVDEAGADMGHVAYEPFGETMATGTALPFRYTGRIPITARLYYYRARFYDTRLARFISEDPIGLTTGVTGSYQYADNDPIDLTDPLGLSASEISPRSLAKVPEVLVNVFDSAMRQLLIFLLSEYNRGLALADAILHSTAWGRTVEERLTANQRTTQSVEDAKDLFQETDVDLLCIDSNDPCCRARVRRNRY
jgi:RHS repeat-associated protein